MSTALFLLAIGFAASAVFRLLRMRYRGWAIGLWALPRGPAYALSLLELLTALFLVIPMTMIWGLALASMIAACHGFALWRTHPVRT